MHAKIAAFGESDIMQIFKAIGVDVYPVNDTDEVGMIEKSLKKMVREGYGVIFITETLAIKLDQLIKEYSNKILPSIVVIPGPGERKEYAVRILRRAIIKAVGADVMGEGNRGV